MRKKLALTLVLTASMLSVLVGCGNKTGDTQIDDVKVTTEVVSDEAAKDDSEKTEDNDTKKDSKKTKKSSKKKSTESTETTESTEATTVEVTTAAATSEQTSTEATTTSASIVGVHDVTVPIGTDYNTFIDLLIEGVSGRGEVIPHTDNVNLNKKGNYTVSWTCDGKEKATCTVTVTKN